MAAALLNRRHQQRRPPTLASMTKVSKNGQTRTAASLNRQEEMNLRPIARASPHDFERADRAGSDGGEDRADGADGPEEPPPQVPLAELQRRAGIMFSGDTGAVVASGSGPATTAATFELARDVRKVILGLPAVLFERSAKPRPCGLLCKLSAAGMLMCDVLGLPLTPFVLAEPIGKEAARLADKISAEVKKAKKAAAGKGMTPQEAEAAFVRRRIKLPLPSAAEIAKTWRQIEREAMPPPPAKKAALQSPSPPPAAMPPPSTPSAAEPKPQVDFTGVGDRSVPFFATERHPEIPGYRGRPGGDDEERFWNPAMPPHACRPTTGLRASLTRVRLLRRQERRHAWKILHHHLPTTKSTARTTTTLCGISTRTSTRSHASSAQAEAPPPPGSLSRGWRRAPYSAVSVRSWGPRGVAVGGPDRRAGFL